MASSKDSSGPGWPQKVFVHTPGQVFFDSARRVTRTSPSVFRTWHENARCRGVWAVCTVNLSAVPIGVRSSARSTTDSGKAFICLDRLGQ